MRLASTGAVVVEGPKACGKTVTARRMAASEVLLDVDDEARLAVAVDPALVLAGDTPRLIAIARVRQRVLEGGHDIPDAVIRRRFHAGWRNWERTYRNLVDEWAVYDNSARTPVLVAEKGRS